MRKFWKRIACAAFALLTVPLIGGVSFTAANASSVAEEAFSDSFVADSIDSSLWTASGADIKMADAGGALVMNGDNMGWNYSLLYRKIDFERDKHYTVEFDFSVKCEGNAWLGVVFGGTQLGATFEKYSSASLVITPSKEGGNMVNYLNPDKGDPTSKGVPAGSANAGAVYTNGTAAAIKIDIYPHAEKSGESKADIYIKLAKDDEYGDKIATADVGDITGNLCFQANGDSTVKIMNFTVSEGETPRVIAEENFEQPTEKLICFTDDYSDFSFRAQSRNISTGVQKGLKFDNAQNATLTSSKAIIKDDDCVENFVLTYEADVEAEENNGFGIKFESGDSVSFIKNGTGKYDLTQTAGEQAQSIAQNVEIAARAEVRLSGRYDGSVKVAVDGTLAGTAEGIDFAGKPALASFGTATAYVYGASLLNYRYVSNANAPKISNNFNTAVSDTSSNGYIDTSKWRTEGNCTARNKVMRFQSGDVFTSFNTVNKYQDFVLRFDVTRILATVKGSSPAGYPVRQYNEMSFGVSLGKSDYRMSTIDSSHPLLHFCNVYYNPTPNMVIWGHGGLRLETGEEAAWPAENWWHDGTDGKVITDDGVSINVMVVARNRKVYVYYKYSNQDESCFDTPKAVFANVNTYGYVAISCGSGNSFDFDNISITPLNAESYL